MYKDKGGACIVDPFSSDLTDESRACRCCATVNVRLTPFITDREISMVWYRRHPGTERKRLGKVHDDWPRRMCLRHRSDVA